MMQYVADWKREYIKHNAFSMTVPQLHEALAIDVSTLHTVMDELNITPLRPGDAFEYEVITMEGKPGEVKYEAITAIQKLRQMALLGSTVEEIAASLLISVNTAYAKLLQNHLPIKWKNKVPGFSKLNQFIVENYETMFLDELARKLNRGKDFIEMKLRLLGLIPRLNPDKITAKKTVSNKSRQKYVAQYIRENCRVETVEDIASHLVMDKYAVATKIRKLFVTPKWKEKQRAGERTLTTKF
jgi:hypothetical protein